MGTTQEIGGVNHGDISTISHQGIADLEDTSGACGDDGIDGAGFGDSLRFQIPDLHRQIRLEERKGSPETATEIGILEAYEMGRPTNDGYGLGFHALMFPQMTRGVVNDGKRQHRNLGHIGKRCNEFVEIHHGDRYALVFLQGGAARGTTGDNTTHMRGMLLKDRAVLLRQGTGQFLLSGRSMRESAAIHRRIIYHSDSMTIENRNDTERCLGEYESHRTAGGKKHIETMKALGCRIIRYPFVK
ncbi:MAG: hypothetical protein MZV49_13245 [Rhodopseudomonas palustris]|nr:hypothetical protein [Rhodopseudomonas palustris]